MKYWTKLTNNWRIRELMSIDDEIEMHEAEIQRLKEQRYKIAQKVLCEDSPASLFRIRARQ